MRSWVPKIGILQSRLDQISLNPITMTTKQAVKARQLGDAKSAQGVGLQNGPVR